MSTYGPSTASRHRRTRVELDDLDDAIVAAVEVEAPVTLRGVYYRVVSAGAIDKTETGYRTIGRQLLKLRRSGRVRYADITDGTRWVTAPITYDSVEEALQNTARTYRRALWTRSPWRIHVFTEKDAISGVILPVTRRWDLPLGVLRGYVSETFAWNVAQSLDPTRTNWLVQFGDHDPSGVGAWEDFVAKVSGFAGDIAMDFERLAVTVDQIVRLDLPTRPTKHSDSRSASWSGGSVEVDAIPAPTLRDILERFITAYVDEHELRVLATAEQDERRVLLRLARRAS